MGIRRFVSRNNLSNAVKTQIWIAVSTCLLVATLKKRLRVELPLYTILQMR
jgi:hypothetical protein